MTTYKGTDRAMKCRGFQYELGKKFTWDGAVRCGDRGGHSVVCPMDALSYYSPVDGSRYFECEAGGTIDGKNNVDSKIASSELTLKSEIGLDGLIKEQFDYVKQLAEGNAAQEDGDHAVAQEDGGHAVAQEDGDHAAAQGEGGHAAAQGYLGHAAAQGDWGHAAAKGACGHAAAQGDWGHAVAQGVLGHAAAQGEGGHAAAQGYLGHAAAQGDRGHAATQGLRGHAAAQGDWGHAAARGDRGHAAAQGHVSHAEVHGEDAIAAAFGVDGRVMAGKVGAWLTAYEWENTGSGFHIKTGKCVRVDGEKIKPNVWYTLKNGEFVEVEE